MIIRDDPPATIPKDVKSPIPPVTNPIDEPPPPPYTFGTQRPTSTRSRSHPQAANYLSIRQPVGSLEGIYFLDPFLPMPPKYMLPSLGIGQTEEDRKNLSLKASVGAINADITILGGSETESSAKRRVDMEVRTRVGAVFVKVRESSTQAPSSAYNRLPFHLLCSTQMGSINLLLPNSFHGFITVTTSVGHVSISPELSANTSWMDSGMRKRRIFVGDMHVVGDVGSWAGDEVVVETPVGTVDIGYSDY
ncbi:hypothetical protein D9758_012485 [Tetrapyrgos nigripes]|uniref:DUF7330 domain-containing protein n=1 Tax=Tetrapyrgos nigripes TaxID=182062 RepID=A0A8H5CZG2_9AGAR|nr:hypothetical protein D9758_012485 [Tetrapyrgos nigripes]